MKKWIIPIILIIVMCQIVFAPTEVEISTDNSTWVDITDTQYGGSIDETNESAYISLLSPGTEYYLRARNSTTTWAYRTQRTEIGGENIMASLAIVIFVLSIVIGLFILPFKVKRFSQNEILNDFLKKACWMLGLLFLSLSTAMVATIASEAGIDLLNEIYTFLRVINFGVYLFMVFLVLSFFIKALYLWQTEAKRIRLE